jgi:hypothetical protein
MSSTTIKINNEVSMVISAAENNTVVISTQPGTHPITLDKACMQLALITLHKICEQPTSITVQYPDRLTPDARTYFLGQCIDQNVSTNVTSNTTNRVPSDVMFICNTTIDIPDRTETNSPENVTPPPPPSSPAFQ